MKQIVVLYLLANGILMAAEPFDSECRYKTLYSVSPGGGFNVEACIVDNRSDEPVFFSLLDKRVNGEYTVEEMGTDNALQRFFYQRPRVGDAPSLSDRMTDLGGIGTPIVYDSHSPYMPLQFIKKVMPGESFSFITVSASAPQFKNRIICLPWADVDKVFPTKYINENFLFPDSVFLWYGDTEMGNGCE